MKKVFKLICIFSLAALFTVAAFAIGGKCGTNATWEFTEGTLTITGSGEMTDYEKMKTPWYAYNNLIKNIKFDDRITHIGDNSFEFCSQFEEVILPENLETIGHFAFAHCSALKIATLPSKLRIIGEDAFAGTKISKVVLPKNLEKIWSGAFTSCSMLEAYEIENGNENFKIVDGVLYDRKMQTLYGYPAGKENTTFTVPDGVYYITASAFQGSNKLQTLLLPEGLERIGTAAFYGCQNLESLYIPESLISRGGLLFASRAAVTVYGVAESLAEKIAKEYNLAFSTGKVPVNTVSYTYKDKTLYIHGEGAIRTYSQGEAPWYEHGSEVKDIIIEEGITKISAGAFWDFHLVEYVEIPASVKAIDETFQTCWNIQNFYVSEESKYFCTEDGVIFSKDEKKIIRYPWGRNDAHYSIMIGVEEIDDYAFNGAKFETVEIPNSVKKIGNFAFMNCQKLTAVRIPSGVTELKTFSFMSKNLHGIYIPKSVTKITNTFGNTEELTIYGERGSYAEKYAKEKGIEFSTKEMPETFFSWFFEDGILTIKNMGEMQDYNSYNNPAPWLVYSEEIREVVLSDGITSVGEGSFEKCSFLEKVTLPETVTKIKSEAFVFCSKLREINFPDGITEIGASVFYGCEALCDIKLPKNLKKIYNDAFADCGIKELILPEGLEYIGDRAFSMCDSLQTVFIPSSVNEMGDFPFLLCRGLSSVEVDESNKYFSSIDGVLFNKEQTALLGYPMGKANLVYFVPESVKTIGNRAFYGREFLVSAVFHDGIKHIGEYVFAYDIRFTVHAPKDSIIEEHANQSKVKFLPIEIDTEAKEPVKLLDVLSLLNNFEASKTNELLTKLLQLVK